MLTVERLNVFHGDVQVLFDVALTVEPGEIVSIVGANAAGKTSLLLAISGLLRRKTGNIHFEGDPIGDLAPNAIVDRGIVHIPQGRRVFPMLSVEENLEVGAYTPRARPDRKALLQEIYGHFPKLHALRRQLAGSLSGGEQQMLCIGRALMSRPRLLLLDEPSLGLAPKIVKQIFDLVASIRAGGTSILLVEQNVRAALKVADYGYVMEGGRVVLEGPAAQLRDDPRVRDAYLGGGS